MKRGRKKERTQISCRVDTALLDIARHAIKGTPTRMTDMMERAMVLALRETGCTVPTNHHARLILPDEGPEFAQLVIDINTIRRFSEVRALSPGEEVTWEALSLIVRSARQWPNADKVLKLMGTPKESEETLP